MRKFYKLLRPFAFMLEPEKAHHMALQYLIREGKKGYIQPPDHQPIQLMGLSFPNRVGLAAGFDKNAVAVPGIARLGFGHIEVGTVTPKAQPGNPSPRIFRLPREQALINRMGFPNEGVLALVERVKTLQDKPILGINIGKNKDTSLEDAVNDYVYCLQKVYPYADYVTVNISSPNTPGLRDLQQADKLENMLSTLKNMQSFLSHEYERYVPLVVKVSPDLTPSNVAQISEVLLSTGIDGLIATNTTLSRTGVLKHAAATEPGGLSGAPLAFQSNEIIRQFRRQLTPNFPIIGVGGIMSQHDAQEKIQAGAQLLQLYTGLIYQGPKLISEIVRA